MLCVGSAGSVSARCEYKMSEQDVRAYFGLESGVCDLHRIRVSPIDLSLSHSIQLAATHLTKI
jgi:hypothetical protein